MQVASSGGDYEVAYTLINPIGDLKIVAECSNEWISNTTVDEQYVRFNVAPNTFEEPRTGTIELKYPNIENPTKILITQAASDGALFTIAIEELTSTTCTTTVTPDDNEMAYIIYSAAVDYFHQMGITTAEQLFEDDYNYFKGYADQYGAANLGQFMLMNSIAFMGENSITWSGLTPGEPFVIYAYGIEFSDDMKDYSLATPVYYEIITPPYPELSNIEFDVDIEVNGPEISYSFAPINWDGYYSFEIFADGDSGYIPEGTVVDAAITQQFASRWLSTVNPLILQGYDAEQLIALMCLRGPDSYNEIRIADMGYMIAFYAVDIIDGVPQVCSKPQLFHFRTEAVAASEMTFEIETNNVYVRVADVTITPTGNDPYTIALFDTARVPEGSDEEILKWVTESFNLSLFSGTVNTHLNILEPESDYTILVFGYYGGVITTDLYRRDFRTEAEGVCENSVVEVLWNGPYSPQELADAMPDLYGHISMYEPYGFYMMWMEIVTEQPSTDVFHYHYELSDLEQLGEQAIFDDLVSYNYKHTEVIAAMSGVEFVMCGVTMDYRGNYSDMWISEPFSYVYSQETKRPIEELLERISGTRSGQLVMVGRDERGNQQIIPIMR